MTATERVTSRAIHSELRQYHRYTDCSKLRARKEMPAGLYGTGQVFTRDLLDKFRQLLPELHTSKQKDTFIGLT